MISCIESYQGTSSSVPDIERRQPEGNGVFEKGFARFEYEDGDFLSRPCDSWGHRIVRCREDGRRGVDHRGSAGFRFAKNFQATAKATSEASYGDNTALLDCGLVWHHFSLDWRVAATGRSDGKRWRTRPGLMSFGGSDASALSKKRRFRIATLGS